MEQHLSFTQPWAKAVVRSRVRYHKLTAWVFLLVASAACFVTAFVIFGLFMVMGVVLGALGISPPHPTVIAPVATFFQFIVYFFARDAELPLLTVERADDTGELVLARPAATARLGWYDQENGYSIWRTVASIALATPIAVAQAWRHFKRAGFMKQTDTDGLARLAAYLLSRMERADLPQIQRDLPGIDLPQLLPRLMNLPGFNVHLAEPQGVSLTEGGQETLLARVA